MSKRVGSFSNIKRSQDRLEDNFSLSKHCLQANSICICIILESILNISRPDLPTSYIFVVFLINPARQVAAFFSFFCTFNWNTTMNQIKELVREK